RGEAVGGDGGGAASGQRGPRGEPPGGPWRPVRERQEVRVAPDVLGAALDPATQLTDVATAAGVLVGDLQRTEAALAHVQRLQRVLGLALLALQMTHSHCGSLRSSLRRVTVWRRARRPATHLLELAPSRP